MTRTILLALLSVVALAGFLATDAQAVYHPRLGRFLQRDPIGYADGSNLYEVARSDPANQRDPLGLQSSASSADTSDETVCCGTEPYDPETECCVDEANSEVISECAAPAGFEVASQQIDPPGKKPNESLYRRALRWAGVAIESTASFGFLHHDVYRDGRLIRLGWYGPPAGGSEGISPGAQRWPLTRSEDGRLRWGRSDGVECRCATGEMIEGCIRSAPAPAKWFLPGINTCQQDTQHAMEGCCLSGYDATGLPPLEVFY